MDVKHSISVFFNFSHVANNNEILRHAIDEISDSLPKTVVRDRPGVVDRGVYCVGKSSKFAFRLPLGAGLQKMSRYSGFQLPSKYYNPALKKTRTKDWKPLYRNAYSSGMRSKLQRDRLARPACVCKNDCAEDCLNRALRYECSDAICKAANCTNRQIQEFYRQQKLGNAYTCGYEVFLAGQKGHGLRAIRDYTAGELILEYTGEIIDKSMLNERLLANRGTHFYILCMNKGMYIDASVRGSEARFANHSCDPNSQMELWLIDDEPHMCLFAGSQGIRNGDEICYNYNFSWFQGSEPLKCLCGAANCTGFMGTQA
ncbi:hypothetical protein CANCADRAFT_2256 [Tortispora caseinolytica NRRL Y-17796]|uniref:SET domain-containing protein n=1 Tax=Tortispora caseinolytica NRRL Y-17796 TaxID=767744 RepID=A0A1E4TFS7_9ASCO|nr:hypothetical protein CANCADRAFT_2256 [Tortispora caseinolytica NRRL Y-17796]